LDVSLQGCIRVGGELLLFLLLLPADDRRHGTLKIKKILN